MPGIGEVLATFRSVVITGLAPYQPNVPPDYPNPLTTAGTIIPTLITTGHPIQFHILKRMENHQAQVVIYDIDPGKPMPYINDVEPEFTSPIISGQGYYNLSFGRAIKSVVVEIWSPDHNQRGVIADLIRQQLGDYFRIYHSDGTTTLLKYMNEHTWDREQVDTIYIRSLFYTADYVEVTKVYVSEVVEALSTLTVEAETF